MSRIEELDLGKPYESGYANPRLSKIAYIELSTANGDLMFSNKY